MVEADHTAIALADGKMSFLKGCVGRREELVLTLLGAARMVQVMQSSPTKSLR